MVGCMLVTLLYQVFGDFYYKVQEGEYWGFMGIG